MLTLDSLIRKGFLHDHCIPALSTNKMADDLANLPLSPLDPALDLWKSPTHSRCAKHSVPKRSHSRRILAIPNPQHHIPLCVKLTERWPEIERHCKSSGLSVSTPTVKDRSPRAVGPSAYFRELSFERVVRSAGCRFHLYADFARYYSSIYTHSIAWALHGKDAAQADTKGILTGNQIDRLIRSTQGRQSIGLPVGPDTSLIVAEIVATAMDKEIQAGGVTQGLRYIDDFHLYFRSRGECEKAIATIHGACRKYELDINDAKTLIEELPDVCEPPWKVALRTFPFGSSKNADADVLSYFNLAFQLSNVHPFDGVLKYAVSRSDGIKFEDFTLYEALLCRCMIAEPGCLPETLRILEKHQFHVTLYPEPLSRSVEELCRYHAPLQHGYEVAWAIWIAVQFKLRISDEAAALVSMVEDDSVALAALHARELDLMKPDPNPIWRSWLTTEHLNQEHWLAAYEFGIKGWLTPVNGADYIGAHKFFSVLREHSVSFYDMHTADDIEVEGAVLV